MSLGTTTLPIPTKDIHRIMAVEHKVVHQAVSREVARVLNMPVKKCRTIMTKKAHGYILDQENLRYWGGDVPQVIVDIFGQKIITIATLVKNGTPLSRIIPKGDSVTVMELETTHMPITVPTPSPEHESTTGETQAVDTPIIYMAPPRTNTVFTSVRPCRWRKTTPGVSSHHNHTKSPQANTRALKGIVCNGDGCLPRRSPIRISVRGP